MKNSNGNHDKSSACIVRHENSSSIDTGRLVTDGGVEPAPLHDLTGFQRDLLRVIAGSDESHGLGIKQELEAAYDGKEVHHSRLYTNLDKLADKGLIERGEIDRRTNSYQITPRGRRELAADRRWRSASVGDGGEVVEQ